MHIIRRISFPGFLVLLWMLSIVLVNPMGDFPLNDDWAFAEGVYSIVETGTLVPSDWPAMTLVAQLYWGALFCKIFGLSATVLRWCTLLSSLAGALAFYFLGREISKNRALVAFATLVLFFNPLHFSLSFTFMTDVHFLCAILLAFLFFSKDVKSSKLTHWLLGTFFSVVATLIRQPGLMIPLTFAFIYLLGKPLTLWKAIKATLPLLLSLLGYFIYMQWLNAGNDAAQTVHIIDHLIQGILKNDLTYFLERTVTVLLYVGLFLLPFTLISALPESWQNRKRYSWKLAIGGLILVLLYLGSSSFPFGNVLYNLGLGPKILKDTYWGSNIHPQLSTSSWKALVYPSIIAATLLFLKIPLKIRSLKLTFREGPLQTDRLIRLALLIIIGIYTVFLIIGPYLFDRYTLPLIAFSILFFLPYQEKTYSRIGKSIAWFLLVGFTFFSLAGTQHYLSWNRTRWKALDQLMTEKEIPANRIDGGFEFNTWLKTGPYNKEDRHGKSWWRVAEDDYIVTFGRLPNFEVRDIWPVQAAWPFHRDSIFVLWHMVDGLTLYENYPIQCGAEVLAPDPYYFTSNLPQVKFHHDLAQSDAKAHSGQFSMELSGGKEYGFSTNLKDIRPGDEISIRVWRWDESRSAGLVLSNQGGETFYQFEKANVIQEQTGWQQLELKVQIPTEPGFDQVGIYVWNPMKQDVWFDDLEIDRKPAKVSIESDE